MRKLFLLLVLGVCGTVTAQDIDVLHYEYKISLVEKTGDINVEARIKITFLDHTDKFSLDLVKAAGPFGMKINSVLGRSGQLRYEHQFSDKLIIYLPEPAVKGSEKEFWVVYTGAPGDGLIISKNKYGDVTFFADNWPNRARHWLVCNDRPDDKATVEFRVLAPKGYSVVSNGTGEAIRSGRGVFGNVHGENSEYHWKETTPIPTKVMVIGAARFAVKEYEERPNGIPVSAWVYPQDSTKGFYDYALAVPILKFFQEYIGPYPFARLANVQSKTIFGGMENAGCIFYSESSIDGKRSAEALIAHEIVHQWFGNSATEKHFSHLWLSEGFATHLTNVYLEHVYGKDTVLKRLQADREKIVGFLRKNPLPVVDSVSAWMDLLNPNSYQKGGWILRMIQAEVGDDNFRQIIRNYYENFALNNAETKDFQETVQRVTGQDWQMFFDQWLHRPSIPKLDISWNQASGKVELKIEQKGELYQFPLEFKVVLEDGRTFLRKEIMSNQVMVIDVFTDGKVKEIIIDPNVKLLADFHILTAKALSQ